MQDRDPASRIDSNIPDWAGRIPLDRPLAIIDLEATGTSPYRDRILEIAVVKVHPDGKKESHTRRVNPGVPIPVEASAVHGIYDADVAREPEFRQIASNLAEYLADCDLAGFGILSYDIPLLMMEFERADVDFDIDARHIIDAKNIYHAREPRTLAAAHRFYVGEDFAGAHSAEADALATYRVLIGQIQRYEDLPSSVSELDHVCNPLREARVDRDGRLVWRGEDVFFNFGKHRDEPLREVAMTDPEYIEWLLEKEFPARLKSIFAAASQGTFPKRDKPPESRS